MADGVLTVHQKFKSCVILTFYLALSCLVSLCLAVLMTWNNNFIVKIEKVPKETVALILTAGFLFLIKF